MATVEAETAQPIRRCEHLTKSGKACTMPPLHGTSTCMAHRDGAAETRERATAASARKRRERVAARQAARERSAQDWIAVKLEERGERIAEAVAVAAEKGDWRAAVALWERVYGRPVERVEAVSLDVDLRSLTDDQLAQVRARLQAQGAALGAAPAQTQ